MKEMLFIICCFVFSAAVIYITINKIYDAVLPDEEMKRSYAPEYRILTDNLDMLRLVRKHFEPGEYSLCLKSRPEILNECREENVSIAVLEPVIDQGKHGRVKMS